MTDETPRTPITPATPPVPATPRNRGTPRTPKTPRTPGTLSGRVTQGAAEALTRVDEAQSVGVAMTASMHFRVIAREGLQLRAGPGTEFWPLRSLPFGTSLRIIRRDGPWVLIDLVGDGAADGHVHASYLEEVLTQVEDSADG